MELLGFSNVRNAPKNDDELKNKQDWKFWNTQPVKPLGDRVGSGVNEPIEADKKKEEIKEDPFNLPEGFHWDDIDLNNQEQVRAFILNNLVLLILHLNSKASRTLCFIE